MPIFVCGLSPDTILPSDGRLQPLPHKRLPLSLSWSVACYLTPETGLEHCHVMSINTAQPHGVVLPSNAQAVASTETGLVYWTADTNQLHCTDIEGSSSETVTIPHLVMSPTALLAATLDHFMLLSSHPDTLIPVPFNPRAPSPWPALLPLPIGLGQRTIVALACGKEHVLVLLDDGNVATAGRNAMGQLGLEHVNTTYELQ